MSGSGKACGTSRISQVWSVRPASEALAEKLVTDPSTGARRQKWRIGRASGDETT